MAILNQKVERKGKSIDWSSLYNTWIVYWIFFFGGGHFWVSLHDQIFFLFYINAKENLIQLLIIIICVYKWYVFFRKIWIKIFFTIIIHLDKYSIHFFLFLPENCYLWLHLDILTWSFFYNIFINEKNLYMDSKILYLDSHTHTHKCILFQYFDGGVRVENGNLIFMIHTHTSLCM